MSTELRIQIVGAFAQLLFTCLLVGCSASERHQDAVLKSATIEIQFDLRTQHKTIQAPVVVEVTDPAIVRKLRNEFRAGPNRGSGLKSPWTATGSVTFVDEHGEKARFLFGFSDWALTGEDNEYPLPEGFNDRLIEVIEDHRSE